MMNQGCWANSTSKCDGKLTLEHDFSMGAWQVEDPDANRKSKGATRVKVVGPGTTTIRSTLRTLGQRSLCEHHNNSSSVLDEEGKRFADAFRLYAERLRTTQGSGMRWTSKSIDIDGLLVERWLLKTAVNMARRVAPRDAVGGPGNPGKATATLVEIIFEGQPLTEGYGAWQITKPNQRVDLDRHVRSTVWGDRARGVIEGSVVGIWGLHFAVSLTSQVPDWDGIRRLLGWKGVEARRPYLGLNDRRVGLTLRLNW
jgi:hypothetical protein